MKTAERMLTQTGTYIIDPVHSRIGFTVRHAMVTKLRGSFNRFEGSGYFDIERPESSAVSITIDPRSIDTRHDGRDSHLMGSDFLDVATHPTIAFAATTVDQIGDRAYRMVGDLTMKGITKLVVLEVERTGWLVAADRIQRIGFEGRGVIDRRDWGIAWNKVFDTGGVLISDHVTIEFEISAIKSAVPFKFEAH